MQCMQAWKRLIWKGILEFMPFFLRFQIYQLLLIRTKAIQRMNLVVRIILGMIMTLLKMIVELFKNLIGTMSFPSLYLSPQIYNSFLIKKPSMYSEKDNKYCNYLCIKCIIFSDFSAENLLVHIIHKNLNIKIFWRHVSSYAKRHNQTIAQTN